MNRFHQRHRFFLRRGVSFANSFVHADSWKKKDNQEHLASNTMENKSRFCCGEFEEERGKDVNGISFAFWVYRTFLSRSLC